MGRHDTHSGAQPDPDDDAIEARAPLFDAATLDVTDDISKAMRLNDAARLAVSLLFLEHRHEPHLLLDGTITVQRNGDHMVARYTPA